MKLNLDRSTWKRHRFDEIAMSVTDRVDDPGAAGVTRYVGLEHLDPDSMTVDRWGSPDEVSAQKLRFQPGDVIFGRRRAYQRKVSRADFTGICSAHALVLRAKPDIVHPDFLPVFLSSGYFLDRAIRISVGSLSPTVNWKDLARQDFDLPPLDQQQSVANLLWAVEEHRAQLGVQRASMAVAADQTARSELEGDGGQDAGWGRASSKVELVRLRDLATISRGASPRPKGDPTYFAGTERQEHHWITIGDLSRFGDGRTLMDTREFLTPEGVKKSREVFPGDLLLTNCATVGIPIFSGVRGCIHDGFLLFRDLDPRIGEDFLFEFLRMLTPWFRSAAQTGTQANLNTQIVGDVRVPVLTKDRQAHLMDVRQAIVSTSALIEGEATGLSNFRSATLDALWGDA